MRYVIFLRPFRAPSILEALSYSSVLSYLSDLLNLSRSKTFALSLFILPISALQIPSIFADFYEPHPEDYLLKSNETLQSNEHDLLKRAADCPLNYNSCSTLAAADAGACCTSGSVCTTDNAQNIAVCILRALS
jgi:hypothetical protein